MSLVVSPNPAGTARHWDAVEQGAARTGRTADRQQWRIILDVYVARTDGEVRRRAMDGMMGRCWNEFLLPLYLGLGLGPMFKDDPTMKDELIDLEYLCDRLWIGGSPETVARRVREFDGAVGGFGTLCIASYDMQDERAEWEESLQLLTREVMPACNAEPVPACNIEPALTGTAL